MINTADRLSERNDFEGVGWSMAGTSEKLFFVVAAFRAVMS